MSPSFHRKEYPCGTKGNARGTRFQQRIILGQRPLSEGLARYYRLLRNGLQAYLPTTLERKCDSATRPCQVVAAARYILPLIDATVADRRTMEIYNYYWYCKNNCLVAPNRIPFLVHLTKIRKAYNLLSLYNGHCSGLLRERNVPGFLSFRFIISTQLYSCLRLSLPTKPFQIQSNTKSNFYSCAIEISIKA